MLKRWTMAAALASAAALAVVTGPAAEASAGVQVYKVYYNSPGTDTSSNTSLNAEYVTLKNAGTTTANLYGWTLRDAQNHVYKFTSNVYLKPGATLTVHTGRGTNTSTNRYWGLTWYVWNNTGDKVTVKNKAGSTIDYCSWGSSGSYKYC